MKNSFLNLASFLISLILYFLIIIFILYVSINATKHNVVVNFTKNKDAFINVIAIDLDEIATPTKNQSIKDDVKEYVVKQTEQAEEEKLKTTNKSTRQNHINLEDKPSIAKKDGLNLSNLFKDINKTKLKEIKNKEDMIQSRKKSHKTTKTKPSSNTKKQTNGISSDNASGKSQKTGIYNEFMGSVEDILTKIWSSYSALSNQNAIIEITINQDGKLSYKILELSLNNEFNQKIRDFLDRIEDIQFPNPPDKKPFTHTYEMKDLI
ncbi:TonB C-terminal domain-containing protein [Campylobacter sp. FMV-PI01]|uniref:TonB C-terminal domain-containing protein n=1 Tax=Campylobacter portucalensis TaxID=2608384 RepID=A0A6L5WJM2_9BACT|nr:TonB C-terminal domain-containing protein [Campylobacter portucalensis]MSN96642.1 TonB C-terminal domain-containing protein [Campylobacter portucalensis]